MKRKMEKPAYDRCAVGMRLRQRREELGWSRELVSERIGVVNKYYGDIERGTCGMSVETLIALTRLFGLGIDELIYGEEKDRGLDRENLVVKELERLPDRAQDCCLRMLWLFMDGMGYAKNEETHPDGDGK